MGIVLKKSQSSFHWKKYLFSKWFLLFFLLLFFIVNIYGYVFIYKKIVLEQDIHTFKQITQTNFHIVKNWFTGLQAYPEKMVIDIKYVDQQKLLYKREQALEIGNLISEDDDFVPAKITYKGQDYKVSLRLKGDWVEHIEQDKWSYRVKVKDDNTIDGMRIFSLQHPKARNYIYEWIHQEALRKEGVIALRYDFIELVVNGENMGVYALEENFDKQLVEHNTRREGPIIRFNEDDLWNNRARFSANQQQSGSQTYHASSIDTFRRSRIFSDENLNRQYIYGANLLEAFRRGEQPASQVFDVEQMAKFMAISDLFGSNHGTIWHNLRFYVNPINNRLEPIVFDNFGGLPLTQLSIAKPADFNKQLFADQAFTQAYIQQLQRFSQQSYIDSLLDELDTNQQLSKHLKVIYSEFPFHYYSRSLFYNNQKYIQTILTPQDPLLVFTNNTTTNSITLNIANRQIAPLEIVGITDGTTTTYLTSSLIFDPKIEDNPLNYQSITIDTEQLNQTSDWKILYRVLGLKETYQNTIFPWNNDGTAHINNDLLRKTPNIKQFSSQFKIDEKTKIITNIHRELDIGQTIIIPKDYTFSLQKGSRLTLRNNAHIISYSPIESLGTAEQPIIITADPHSKSSFLVFNTPNTSTFRYTEFSNFSQLQEEPVVLTTGIMFYDTAVHLDHCFLKENKTGDDLINIFLSTFYIENSRFEHSTADAIDIDFSNGHIKQSFFQAVGNDAIDVSGAQVRVDNVQMNDVGDKGISVGEQSKLVGKNIQISSSTIGIASKDSSIAYIENTQIVETQLGLAVFQKKPEFSPATIYFTNSSLSTTEQDYLVEKDSLLFFDGERAAENTENLRKFLYDE